MSALACQALLFAVIAGVLGMPAWRDPSKRIWALLAVLLVGLNEIMVGLPIVDPALQPFRGEWNWGGKFLGLFASLIFAGLLIRSGRMDRHALGLAWGQPAVTIQLAMKLVVPALVALVFVLWFVLGVHTRATLETHLFQSSLPGLSEELEYRGLLLALWTRSCSANTDPTPRLGYAAIASTLMFALDHGLSIVDAGHGLRMTLHWMPMALPFGTGLLFAVCRQRTGSLLLPVIFHNAVNELIVLVDMFKP